MEKDGLPMLLCIVKEKALDSKTLDKWKHTKTKLMRFAPSFCVWGRVLAVGKLQRCFFLFFFL